jgi:methylmalonyl-CoA carboxyltransferase small subunit
VGRASVGQPAFGCRLWAFGRVKRVKVSGRRPITVGKRETVGTWGVRVKLRITVDGKAYEVDVEVATQEHPIYGVGGYFPMSPARVPAPAPAVAVPPPPGETTGAAVNEEKVCRSPVSGIVVRITAQPGQQIQVGDGVLVLEAMKMETDITAPVAGKVSKINVDVGDSVKGGQVLVEFE